MSQVTSVAIGKPLALAAWLLLGATAAQAQAPAGNENDAGDDNVTMRLITDPAASLPDAVTRQIVLPESASAKAVESSAKGLETANAARAKDHPGPAAGTGHQAGEGGKAGAAPGAVAADQAQQGLDRAAEARADGRTFAAEAAAAARDRAEATTAEAAGAAQDIREELRRGGGASQDVPSPDLPGNARQPDVPAPASPPGLGH